jgi:cytochrome c-type biogenesis protein CcmH
MGRFDDAIHAYRRIIALLGENASRWSDLGEAIVAQQNGIVSAEAREAFERSVALDATLSKSRFYLALAVEQDGDAPRAIAMLQALQASLDDPAAKMRIEAELERLVPKAPVASGPASQAGEAIAALPLAAQEGAIRAMVDGLEARLASEGGPVADWLRLVQARLVLQERDRALKLLDQAREAHARDRSAIEAIDAFRRSLNLP